MAASAASIWSSVALSLRTSVPGVAGESCFVPLGVQLCLFAIVFAFCSVGAVRRLGEMLLRQLQQDATPDEIGALTPLHFSHLGKLGLAIIQLQKQPHKTVHHKRRAVQQSDSLLAVITMGRRRWRAGWGVHSLDPPLYAVVKGGIIGGIRLHAGPGRSAVVPAAGPLCRRCSARLGQDQGTQ